MVMAELASPIAVLERTYFCFFNGLHSSVLYLVFVLIVVESRHVTTYVDRKHLICDYPMIIES